MGNSATLFDNMLLYGETYYKRALEYLFVSPNVPGYWTLLGLSILTLPAFLLLFIRHKKQERSMRALMIVLALMLCIPAFGYLMSGFSNVSNRFCFGFAFCAAAILMFMSPHFVTLTRREIALIGAGVAVYFALCYFGVEKNYFDSRPILMMAAAAVLLLGLRAAGVRSQSMLLACLLVTCFSVRYTAFWLYDTSENNYVSNFYANANQTINSGQYASLAQSEVLRQDDAYYRVNGNNMVNEELNNAFSYDLYGLTMYPYYGWSNAYVHWIEELELPRRNNKQIFSARAVNAPFQALTGIKYYAMRDSSGMPAPYGFSKVDSVENGSRTDNILQNNNWLSIGYTYDHYMTRDTYDSMNGLGKQEAQLSAILLEETPSLTSLTYFEPQSTAQQIPYDINTDGVTWQNGTLTVSKENGTLTLTFAGLADTETFLRIVDLDLTKGADETAWGVKVSGGGATTWCGFIADGNVYATLQHTQTVDFGYNQAPLTTITITFPDRGSAKLADLEVWCQPMNQFAEQVAALGDESLQNVTTDWRSLRGEITVSKDKFLCLAIPYADGWTAYVDGEETKLYRANTAFMGVELTAGSHTVEIRYWLPGLSIGLAMSGLGAVGLIVLLVIGLRGKKKAFVIRQEG